LRSTATSATDGRGPDRRPAILVAALIAGLLIALIVPALRSYFGLTRPAGIVYETVLPVLVLWFIALAAAYRLRLMDRILGLPDLIKDNPVQPKPHQTAEA